MLNEVILDYVHDMGDSQDLIVAMIPEFVFFIGKPPILFRLTQAESDQNMGC